MAFEDKCLHTGVGTIVRINDRSASINPRDGTKWHLVLAAPLRPVPDV